ncbi:transposase [Anaeromyxobacter oryzisoli]|uniref:transposase n=1 Tax=Anaeromyxobacter oryzisoli TaxID=2925408 RepID=UPI0038CC153B
MGRTGRYVTGTGSSRRPSSTLPRRRRRSLPRRGGPPGGVTDAPREGDRVDRTQPEYAETVAKLCSLRGIAVLSAMVLITESQDFRRFSRPRELMAYLGLIPSEHSSGATERRGGITKTGNSHARRILVEAAWHYRHPPLARHRVSSSPLRSSPPRHATRTGTRSKKRQRRGKTSP